MHREEDGARMTRAEELTLKLADGSISDSEFEELERLVRDDPAARQIHLEQLDLEAELRGERPASDLAEGAMQRLEKRLLADVENGVMERIQARGAAKRPRTARSVRRFQPRSTASWWMFAAAGLFVAAVLFLVLGPSEQTPAPIRTVKESRPRAASPEPSRATAEARIEEIEQKPKAPAQPPWPPAANPVAQEMRRKQAEELQREKERIERELSSARRPQEPTTPKKEEPVPPVQEPPTPAKQEGTTRAVLARLEEVSGEAFLVTKEAKTAAASGMDLLMEQGIETGAGRLVVRFPDKTRVEFGPGTSVTEIKTGQGKRLFVAKGTVRAEVARQPKDQPMIFSTPSSDATVLGTTLRIVVDPDPKKGTRLEVEEGKVQLKNLEGKLALVESGHYAVAAAGAELVSKRTLEDPDILIAHWTFDEAAGPTVADSQGRGLTGTLKNGTARVPGRFGRALYFDGVDDQVEFAPQATLEGLSEITLSAWILISKVPPPSKCAIPVARDGAYRLTIHEGGTVSLACATENYAWFSGGMEPGWGQVPPNTWWHVAGTYDGKQLRMFGNGVLGETKSPVTGAIARSGSPLLLGQMLPGSNVVPFSGMVDDLRIYKRALTQGEIQMLAGGRAKSGSK
jgi:concanavalin A-like lectin/glucanase superfamily protein/FecR-like protein